MSLNKSRFQFQTCVKQFQNCVIIFQTYFIDFRRFGCLIRPISRLIVNRRSNFVLCHSYSNFFHYYSSGFNEKGGGFYALAWKHTERYAMIKLIWEVARQNLTILGIGQNWYGNLYTLHLCKCLKNKSTRKE